MIKKSFGAPLQTTDTLIYQVPDGKRAEWVILYATNVIGSTSNFDVDYYDASENSTLEILDGYSLSSNDFFKIGGEYHAFIAMYEGDKIIGRAAANNDITLLVSVIEYNDIIQGG